MEMAVREEEDDRARPLGNPQHCQLATYADVKNWFVAVIQPDFAREEAQIACGRVSSTCPSPTLRPSLTQPQMEDMRRLDQQYNDGFQGGVSQERPWCLSRWFSPLKPGSVRSGSVALAATSLGSGALALPYAFSLTGIGVGLILMTLAMIVSSLSLQILMVAARYTNSVSYGATLSLVSKKAAFSFVLDLVIVLNGIGAVACMLIFHGDFLPDVFAAPPWGGGVRLDRRVFVVAVAAAAYPVTWAEDLSALRYTSVLVPVVLIITVVLVWTQVPHHLNALPNGSIVWWTFNPKKLLQAVPLMVNAFTNHQNAVPVGNQLDQPSVARIVKTTFNGNFIVFILLVALGIGGYLCWGAETQGDFMNNFSPHNPVIWVCRVLLSITIYFVIPVALSPTSKSCAQIVLSVLPARVPGEQRTVSRPLHLFSSTVCLVICTGIAVATNNIASVIGVLGGLLATSIMFWFPALVFWIALWPTQPRFFRYPVLAMLLFFGVCGYASVVMMFFP